MKKSIIIILVLNLTSLVYGQNSIRQLTDKLKLTSPIYGQDLIREITNNMTIANYKIWDIYNLNVFRYFNLTEHDTPLKQEIFKKTEEYQLKYKQLQKLKSGFFYITIDQMFSGSQYDLKKKGFNLQFNSNSFSDNPPKSLSIENEYGSSRAYIYLKSLPTFRVKSIWKNLYTENLFIPIDETEGLEIENNKDSIKTHFIFKLDGKETLNYQGVNQGVLPFKTSIVSATVIRSNQVRIVIVNSITNKIYYDKSFSTEQKINRSKTAIKHKNK